MKKWFVRSALILLAVFLLFGIIPFPKQIQYSGIGYEFSLESDAVVAEHEVLIDGTYSSVLLLKDLFWGTFYVSDVEGLTEDMRVNWNFEPGKWHHPYFRDYAGQPHSTEIVKLFFDRNFENVALQFATKYEKEGDILKVAADAEKSTFLVVGAKSKEEAYKIYSRVIKEKIP